LAAVTALAASRFACPEAVFASWVRPCHAQAQRRERAFFAGEIFVFDSFLKTNIQVSFFCVLCGFARKTNPIRLNVVNQYGEIPHHLCIMVS